MKWNSYNQFKKLCIHWNLFLQKFRSKPSSHHVLWHTFTYLLDEKGLLMLVRLWFEFGVFVSYVLEYYQ